MAATVPMFALAYGPRRKRAAGRLTREGLAPRHCRRRSPSIAVRVWRKAPLLLLIGLP
ncbi:hypothetical protein [Xylophilus sp.]|uniref:hypothetical protein n=1 Tax=Xylophilus sp. TaxID=2653893 RepID=UPI002D7FEAA3|nr:hypothetical protein [Xylophilus sp.]